MYFVHSYYVIPADTSETVSLSEYGGITYCSSIMRKNVFACQFHPEKSGEAGINIYKSFLNK
jgi:imidazole glycerol-phosphate synthase subunit HisH